MRRFLPMMLILLGILFGSLLLDTPAGRADLTTQYTSIGTLDPQLMTANEDIRLGFQRGGQYPLVIGIPNGHIRRRFRFRHDLILAQEMFDGINY